MTKTILELRSELETILTDQIGDYLYNSGQTVLASCVLPDSTFGWEYPPSGTKVNGLELVLIPSAVIKEKAIIRGSYIVDSTQILLKQWNPNLTTTEATNLIIENCRELLNVRPRLLPGSRKDIIIETQTIFVNNPMIFNWRN